MVFAANVFAELSGDAVEGILQKIRRSYMQGEILYEEKLKILPGVDIGLVPEGSRVDFPFTGDIRGPTYTERLRE